MHLSSGVFCFIAREHLIRSMKKVIYIASLILLTACAKQPNIHQSEERNMTESDLEISKNRTKELNDLERLQIQDWINSQSVKYYPMGMNYWVNIPNLESKHRKNDGEKVSYEYYIYDFDRTKVYETPIGNTNVTFGRFNEMDAVEDVIRYLEKGQEAELLIPSVLAYGTYGDNKKITNDTPLIIKVKVL